MSTNAENNHRENSSLMERKNIEGTPFYMWGDYRGETPKYYITLGDTKITEDYKSQILTSPGIGNKYTNRSDSKKINSMVEIL